MEIRRTSVCGLVSLGGAFDFSFQLLSKGASLESDVRRDPCLERPLVTYLIFVLFSWSASAEAILGSGRGLVVQ